MKKTACQIATGFMCLALFCVANTNTEAHELKRLEYNHPGLEVDLGVGLWAWPLPMDFDGDGDLDLLVSCTDVPYNGLYFFENPDGSQTMPVFKPAVRIGKGMKNVQVSYANGKPIVLSPNAQYPDFLKTKFKEPKAIGLKKNIHKNKVRANQWKKVDYDGDGDLDLLIGVGDWVEYGWDDAFNVKGEWTHGPLHGYVYLVTNRGTDEQPKYEPPVKLKANGQALDVYGMPSPNMADFDGDGDLDLLCGEFVDKFTYFENTGTREKPKFAEGRFLRLGEQVLKVDLCMFVPVAIDWDHDGDIDIIAGQEDGRVMFIEHSGKTIDGVPQFSAPKFFKQQAKEVKFGALATPVGFDWDGDGDDDIICGNTAGQIGFIENLNGAANPKWAEPKLLQADGKEIHIEAGLNGSIQGPCEEKWGYTTLDVADWNHDGLPDIIANSILGKIVWYENIGSKAKPKLAAAEPIEVEWAGVAPCPVWNWWKPNGKELATQWRTTPSVFDFNHDGLNDLVMLDHEGYLVLFERSKRGEELVLLPPKRAFSDKKRNPLRLSLGKAGKSGRRKLCFVDWDLDQNVDLLINSANVNFFRNIGSSHGRVMLDDQGIVDSRRLAGHTSSPTVVDWDKDGTPDLLVGAEDGFFYFMKNPHASKGVLRSGNLE